MDDTNSPGVEQMLEQQHVERYKQQVRDIWRRLIRVHSNLEVMRRVESYGLNEILDPNGLGFWQELLENYGDMVILILTTLVVDQGSDTVDLRRFANRVGRSLKPEYREAYWKQLNDASFEPEHEAVKSKIQHIRNRHIAHVIWNADEPGERSKRPTVSYKEITALVERVRKQFEIVSLTHQYIIELDGYGKRLDGSNERAYIDDLLDQAARGSAVVCCPEQHREHWPERKQHMKPEHLERLTRWRTKLGMSPP